MADENPALVKRDFRDKMSPEELDNVEKFFNEFDTNQDGTLDKFETARLLESLGKPMTSFQVNQFMKSVDTNNDGQMSLREFLVALTGGSKQKRRSRSNSRGSKGSKGKIDLGDLDVSAAAASIKRKIFEQAIAGETDDTEERKAQIRADAAKRKAERDAKKAVEAEEKARAEAEAKAKAEAREAFKNRAAIFDQK